MTNHVTALDIADLAALFGDLLQFVKDFIFSMVSTVVGIITDPIVIGSLVTIGLLYILWGKARAYFAR